MVCQSFARAGARRPLISGLLALFLAACQVSLPGTGVTQVSLLSDTIRVASPAGYCIDTDTLREVDAGAVVLIGRCREPSPAVPAVVTVTIGAPGSAAVLAVGEAALAAYFSSTEGLAMLARSGRASDADMARAEMRGADFLMLVADRDLGAYWRAISGLRGRLVTVSATGAQDVALSAEQGRAILEASLRALHRVNPAPPADPATAEPAPAP